MNVICTICARGGSKGLKNKNVRELLGKPLVAHSIIQAKKSEIFTKIVVSSDSDEILNIASEWGADDIVKRPPHLATDEAAKLPVIQHCVQEIEQKYNMKFDVIVDLDATSPLRTVDDIKNALNMFLEKKASNLITGAPARRSPYFNLVEVDDNGIVNLSKIPSKPIVRRQDSPKCYDMNASIYIWSRESFFLSDTIFQDKTILYIMPEERSVDIDNEIDFELVKLLAKRRGELL